MPGKSGNIPVYKRLDTAPRPESDRHHPVIIVGGGPVGLTAALDLGRRGHEVILASREDFIPHGSRAICFSKRTLDIWNRFGVAEQMVDLGVRWNVGKVFFGASKEPVYTFDVQPLKDQEMPGFINLPQYAAEEILVEALAGLPNVELRWGHELISLDEESGTLHFDTGAGRYSASADWILACDGAKSTVRTLLGKPFEGEAFEDNFLIADIRFLGRQPPERWFWFDPPWEGASALMHRQPDNVWRLDFQLGQDIDRQAALRPEYVERLVKGMIGDDIPFEGVWSSVYRFQCRRMSRFVHGRYVFLGDSAHLVSPFGARGCNSGIADADNLCWKLDAVMNGHGGHDLIETYNLEATQAADINILNSTRSTDFIAPRSPALAVLRDAVLDLAGQHSFARPFVNSGRLSVAIPYANSPLSTPDRDTWTGGVAPGMAAIDAPLADGWLLRQLPGDWRLLTTREVNVPIPVVMADSGSVRERYELIPGSACLIRPDQHVAARWKQFAPEDLERTACPS